MKPLLVHSSKEGKGPLVAVNGLIDCAIRFDNLEGIDEVEILHHTDDGIATIIGVRDSGVYQLGLTKGWLQAKRVASSGSRVDVFLVDN